MAANDFLLAADYARSAVVRDRNGSGLLAWAEYIMALAIPADPSDQWISERIVAERVPLQLDNYTTLTMSYFRGSPNTSAHYRDYLATYNSESEEETLAAEISAVASAVMPIFAKTQVTAEDIAAWKAANGVPVP